MPDYSTRPLDAGAWPDFAELVEAHSGVWGGCWCMAFHSAVADRRHRGQGVASAALAGALAEITRLRGRTVESYPDEVEDRKVSASFLHNGTVAMFEQQGFERTRRIGKTRWVVRKSLG
jgi:GNAT superfamily N-acetyltransferase